MIPPYNSTTPSDCIEIPLSQKNELQNQNADQLLANTPSAFTENKGQLKNDEVRFYDQGGNVWFTDDGVWFELREYAGNRGQGYMTPQTHTLPHSHTPTPTHKYKSVILKQEFMGANQVRPMGRERLGWNSNFFYGNDSSKWRSNVPNYQEIYYKNLYNGIDLRYYINENGLKYDFIVHPSANVEQIRLRYEGAKGLEIDNFGNLIIKTPFENIIDGDLYIYQDYNGMQHFIEGKFVKKNISEYGFKILQDYDKDEILVIDPSVKLDYSTYIGGSDFDDGLNIEIDSLGYAFATGGTCSFDFPTTPGVCNETFSGECDIFMFKLDQTGSALLYSTFIGGSEQEAGEDIVIDSKGNAYSTGYTCSTDFPTTSGAFDRTYNNPTNPGYSDVFALKLNHDGSNLNYSTFIGGIGWDDGRDIAVGSDGIAYLTGITNSSNFPITSGAYDTSYNGGMADCFVLKLQSDGSLLNYSTYIGGDDEDWGEGIAIDSAGNIFVTGKTESLNFPTTTGAYDNSYNGGMDDCFVLKLQSDGSFLNYSTYIGGKYRDCPGSIELDSVGNALITGVTTSSNFPTTEGAFNRTYKGMHDAFALKLNQTGSSIIFSTLIGGDNWDAAGSITMDSNGYVFVTGWTNSTNFPITQDAYDKSLNGSGDGFVIKLNSNGEVLLYSTYLGGNNFETVIGIGYDCANNIYVTGYTNSLDFPTTPGVFNNSKTGDWDVFVSKISFYPQLNITSLSLLINSSPTNLIYSRYSPYTFRIIIIDTYEISEINNVYLTLDPQESNLQLLWDRSTGHFTEVFDPNNYIYISSTSDAKFQVFYWVIDFDLIFNWTYPNEDMSDVQIYATGKTLPSIWFNATNLYQVENDLVFNGTLCVEGEDNQTITENELVRGGEIFNWSGLKVVYENTTNVYPIEDEYDITIWNEAGHSWADSPEAGENFTIQSVTASNTNMDGDTHVINITGIPPECDATNETFIIRIDGDNVTFSNAKPDNTTWQTKSDVNISVNITDIGGGMVNGSSVMYSISMDNGETWDDWQTFPGLKSKVSIEPDDVITFNEGKNNLIKWQAKDSVGNGPAESPEYQILVDTKPVKFSNASPLSTNISTKEEVEVSITISDSTSGVDASSIEYKTSNDFGETWTSWIPFSGSSNGKVINISLKLTFPNGTGNRIKWRASDVAGNGPVESDPFKIKINTWQPRLRVRLLSPENGSVIQTSSIELSWILENRGIFNVTYDIYLDTINPPIKINQSGVINSSLNIDDLSNRETYYWMVIPRIGGNEGSCTSGVWSFTVDIPVPSVTLISPKNGSIIRSPKPTLIWSVEYEGPEIVKYHVFLDTNENPKEFEESGTTHYLPDIILKDGKTYYWKVVPWAGDTEGIESKTWSFTVNKDYIPRIELNLTVNPDMVNLTPASSVQVKAKVTNLGELTDSITISIGVPLGIGIGALVNEPNTMDILPDGTAEFNITVTTAESMEIEADEVILTVVATSGRASEFDMIVKESVELKVKIMTEETPIKEEQKKDYLWDTAEFWILFLIIIIILIIILIIAIILKRKKQIEQDQKEPSPQDSLTVKPGTVPKAVISVGKAPPTFTTPQLQKTIINIESQQQGQAISKVPTLASSTSTTPSHVPTTHQMPEVAQQPQLPPAPTVDETTKNNNQKIKE